MPPVDFLTIAPKEARKELVTVRNADGIEAQVEIQPIDMTDLAKLARKHAGLRPIFAQNAPAEMRAIAFAEFVPQIIAAGLGHIGDERYENAAKLHPDKDKLSKAILELSFGKEDADGPLAKSAADIIAEAAVGTSEAGAAAPLPEPSAS